MITLSSLQTLNSVGFVYGLENVYYLTDGIINDVLNDLDYLFDSRNRKDGNNQWDEFFDRNPDERKMVSDMALNAIRRIVARMDEHPDEDRMPFVAITYRNMIKELSVLL